MTQGGFRLGVDIGGTFTDLVLLSPAGSVVASGKLLSTSDDPAVGAIDGIRRVLEDAGVPAPAVGDIIHATTHASNTIVERTGARVALITTAGFRDILEFGREARYDLYDLALKPVVPLVPRHLRLEVGERLAADGSVLAPVDPAEVAWLAARLNDADVEAVAVCLLHGYRNGANERAVREALGAGGFTGGIVLSSEVCPEIREFERSSTTVANAYLTPRTSGYIGRLADGLGAAGIASPLHLMSSFGGRLTVAAALRRPVELLESGAAAGVLAATTVARQHGWPKVLSFEMGGTTAKAALILDGTPTLARSYEVARAARFKKGSGLPIQTSAIDLIEIGAGGGSIAQVNRLGLVQVGPDSAGSDPGPACYRRGSESPTVTDADLVLGYLNPRGLLDGDMPLDLAAARRAIAEQLAGPLAIAVETAAATIHEVVVETMARAARIHILEHGHDPREFHMIVCGGAGPVHAAAMAGELGIGEVLVLPHAGVAAALGLLEAPPVSIVARSSLSPAEAIAWDGVARLFEDMRQEALADLGGLAGDRARFALSCDMRYRGQGHEVNVPFLCPPFPGDASVRLIEAFTRAYHAKYRRTNPDARVEVVSWRLAAKGPVPNVAPPRLAPAPGRDRPGGMRRSCDNGRFVETPVHARASLGVEAYRRGPALVEERETTTVIPTGATFWVDRFGNLRIRLREGE
jgi:N-methylhydantoinase A